MPHILISPADISNNSVTIRGSEAHHLVRVLRVEAGDPLFLFDGTGTSYKARCESVDAAAPSVHAAITEKTVSERVTTIHLFQGLPKGSKFDYVIEKAVELGVDGLIPFLSDKNIIKLTPAQNTSKLKRWENLAKAAAKQSGRATLPHMESARSFNELEARLKAGLTLFLDTAEKETTFKTLLPKLNAQPKLINIVVGPESDFTGAERALLLKWGAVPVTLGARILRTETAGLVALSILNHELDI